MKTKILYIALPLLFTGLIASAQISGGERATASYEVVSHTSTVVPITTAPTSNANRAMPVNSEDGSFIQFNNLTVVSVSSSGVPGEIVATMNVPMPLPMTDVQVGSTGSSKPMGAQLVNGINNSSSGGSVSTTNTNNCFKFNSKDSKVNTSIPCPTPPPVTATTNTTTEIKAKPDQAMISMGTPSNTPNSGAGTSIATPMTYPPYREAMTYHIKVSAMTVLLFRDRTRATLGSITAGDQINVFGYYNSNGSIEAYFVRDTSKPVERQTLQLNNMTLIGISGESIPATLAVTQSNYNNPCYRFDLKATRMTIACPMGATSFSANSNVKVNEMIAPNWMMQRKYAVVVDANTVILDRNRKQLTLADLKEGDELNIYGETSDNAETISADIVRDMSLPAIPVSMTGTVTTMNSDGSFTLQTNDGRTITVSNPIKIGATVTAQGMYDRRQNVLSLVTQLYFGNFLMMINGGGLPKTGAAATR